jgi:ABC-2 type transport system permease protein
MSGGRRRALLVARREWNQRIRTTAFRVSTVISVLIVVALIAVPDIYGGESKKDRTVGIVGSADAELRALLHVAGERLDLSVRTRSFDDDAAARAALRSGDLAVVLIDEQRLLWKAERDEQLAAVVTGAVQGVRQRQAIADIGLSMEQADRLLRPPALPSTSLDPVTEEQTARADLGRIAVVLLFTMIAFYCGFLLTGVVEEKSSRVVEVLLSRLRPTELLTGKIVGIGIVGLTQFLIVATAGLGTLAATNNDVVPETTPGTLAWIAFWFVLGYAFYSVLFATVGSLVSRQEETQSVAVPMNVLMVVAYVFSFAATEAPDGTAALVGSFLPPTAPMVMIVRIAHGPVPWWHLVLSIALICVAVYGLLRLAGRVYAGGALRFGRRVGLREAWRAAET